MGQMIRLRLEIPLRSKWDQLVSFDTPEDQNQHREKNEDYKWIVVLIIRHWNVIYFCFLDNYMDTLCFLLSFEKMNRGFKSYNLSRFAIIRYVKSSLPLASKVVSLLQV